MLTDGAVVIYGDGSESKRFHIRDGIALVWAQRAGLKVGLLSARHSDTTTQRAAQLGITLVYQGVASKAAAYDQIVGDTVLTNAEVAYMGDDIVDLAVLGRVGLSAAPSDAVAEVRSSRGLREQLPRRRRRRSRTGRDDPSRAGTVGVRSCPVYQHEDGA